MPIIKWSKLLNKLIKIYTNEDEYVIDLLKKTYSNDSIRVCSPRFLNLVNWECVYKTTGYCGKRELISEDINDKKIYNVRYGCMASMIVRRNNKGELFGVKELEYKAILDKSSLYLKYYVHNKIQ